MPDLRTPDDYLEVGRVVSRHHPIQHPHHGDYRPANMSEEDWNKFLREEQMEKGKHPSLQGKKF
jgi:hypothetical protein